jgi:Carboxypeptidase regulatory-like domain/TonB-dependent Receptor Plug Domain
MRLTVRVGIVVALAVAARGSVAQSRPSVVRGTMDGIVTDSSLVPLGGATITLLGSSITATTTENGRFRIVALPAGEYVVMARRLGYGGASVTLHVEGGDTLRPAFALQRVVAQLDTVRASAAYARTRLGEFDERRAAKVGHFITADEIDKRNPVYVSDMLRSVLSVTIEERTTGGPPRRVAVSKRSPMASLRSATCPFQIFVDGLIFAEDGDLTNVPSPSNIAGVEVYSGPATIPLQYKRHDSLCGVILIWTKDGG